MSLESKSASVKKKGGFCVYLGPTIIGVITYGKVFRGTKDDAYKSAAFAIDKNPLIKKMIVTSDTLVEDRIKAKTPGNLLYEIYQQILTNK